MILPRRASRDGSVARAWTPATSRRVLTQRTTDDGQLLVVLGEGRNDLRRSDRILGVGDGSRALEHGAERREGRALEGTQREPVLGDLVARAGCPDLAAQVRDLLDGQTGLAGDHHQVRVLEDLVQLDDRLGLFRTIHGFLQLWPNPGDPDRTGCVTDHAASVSGLARTETLRSGSPAPEVRARARTLEVQRRFPCPRLRRRVSPLRSLPKGRSTCGLGQVELEALRPLRSLRRRPKPTTETRKLSRRPRSG